MDSQELSDRLKEAKVCLDFFLVVQIGGYFLKSRIYNQYATAVNNDCFLDESQKKYLIKREKIALILPLGLDQCYTYLTRNTAVNMVKGISNKAKEEYGKGKISADELTRECYLEITTTSSKSGFGLNDADLA